MVKMVNWLGFFFVVVVVVGVQEILFLGYYGKLIKLVGGIFYIYYYLVDGCLEIFIV